MISMRRSRVGSSAALILAMSASAVWGDTIWEGQIDDEMDDVEEDVGGGGIDTGSSDLELPNDGGIQWIGIRFINVTVPKGSAISRTCRARGD